MVQETRKQTRQESVAIKRQRQDVLKGPLADIDTIESRKLAMAEADSVSSAISAMAALGSSSSAVKLSDFRIDSISATTSSHSPLITQPAGLPIRPDNLDDRDAWASYSAALDHRDPLVGELDDEEEESLSRQVWNGLPSHFRNEIAKHPKHVECPRPSADGNSTATTSSNSAGEDDFLVDVMPSAVEIPEELEPDYLNLPHDLLSLYFMQGVLQPILDERLMQNHKVSIYYIIILAHTIQLTCFGGSR